MFGRFKRVCSSLENFNIGQNYFSKYWEQTVTFETPFLLKQFHHRFISSKNRAALNFTLAPNELSDVTENEFEMYKGLLIDPSGGDDGLKKQEIPEARLTIPTTPLPDSLDWREYGTFNK